MASVRSYFSSPSPSLRPAIKHDVFVSFRGEDIRDNFLSHLKEAFDRKVIDAFIDDQLERGQEISPALLQAIEESQISVVIFSENYADSTWCLEELEKILERNKNHGQIVIPVFYKIEPSEVRKQTGSYADAFDKHKDRFKEDLDKVQKWRDDLKEAANISGFVSNVVKPESKLVENIVEDVLKWLNINMPPCDTKDLVGIDSSIKKLETMLERGIVGIWGFGGIGKTTLASALFNKFSCQFDASYFADSVREASKQHFGLNCLRRGLLSALLGDENIHIGTFMKKMRHKKFLIVLDDVSDLRQVELLIGNHRCLGSKSRIIITSRNKQVLKNCCVDDNIYEVEELCFSDALKLFCRNAFRQNHPNVDYTKLSNSVVNMVGGIPLALKVLGSSLFGKTKEVWESAMEKLENFFDRNIHKILKISYKELDTDQQNIFLDIACFFRWWDIDRVKAFMKACGFFPDNGIDVLIDKSLITISNNMLTMHDLLQAMGKEIVRQESTNDLGKRSRLWHHKDIYDVLTNETGTKMLEGISLDMSKSEDIHLHPRAFANMQNLRLLNFYDNRCYKNNRVHVSQDLESIFTNLRYLNWHGCPLKSLQSNVLSENKVHVSRGLESNLTNLRYLNWDGCPLKSLQSNVRSEYLVELRMRKSEVKELWSGSPQLGNLKIIDLLGSQYLTRLPDLSEAPNLESLDLSYCTSLTEIPSSIQHLPKLQSMCLRNCENLMSIPDCNGLKSLKKIVLDCCYKIKVAPKLLNNFEKLDFINLTSLCEIPSSYKNLNKLESLSFNGCKSLTGIPDYSGLKSLTWLEITGCSKVKMLPEFPNNIERLALSGIPIEELPSSSENLCRLIYLTISDCSRLKSLPSSVCKWKNLTALRLTNCSKIDKLPDSLGCLTSLKYLYLDKINFESIPESIINLSELNFIDIIYCERLKVLPKLPWACITAVNCTSLQQISGAVRNVKLAQRDGEYYFTDFINCLKLDQISLNNHVRDSLLKIQDLAASAKKIFYQKVCLRCPPPITIRYPGSEIPEWFEYQNRGSFVDVNLPPNWLNYNFLCFALCIVVAIPGRQSVQHDQYFRNVRCECSLYPKEGGPSVVTNNLMRWKASAGFNGGYDCVRYPSHSFSSNHIEINFDFHFFSELYNPVSFDFYIDSYSYHEGLDIDNYKVEKCGVHLMWGKHLDIDQLQVEKCGVHLMWGKHLDIDQLQG